MGWFGGLIDLIGSTMTTCKTCRHRYSKMIDSGEFNLDTKKINGRIYKDICGKYDVELKNYKACEDHYWGR